MSAKLGRYGWSGRSQGTSRTLTIITTTVKGTPTRTKSPNAYLPGATTSVFTGDEIGVMNAADEARATPPVFWSAMENGSMPTISTSVFQWMEAYALSASYRWKDFRMLDAFRESPGNMRRLRCSISSVVRSSE